MGIHVGIKPGITIPVSKRSGKLLLSIRSQNKKNQTAL